jgi:hypothetical protein
MIRICPMTWAALHIALAGAATYLLCSTDLLHGTSLFLIH